VKLVDCNASPQSMIKLLSNSLRRSHNMLGTGKNGRLESTTTRVIVSGGEILNDCGFARLWNSFLNSESAAGDFYTEIIEVEKQIRISHRGPSQVYSKEFSRQMQSSLTEHAILRAIDSVWKHPEAIGSLRFLLQAFTKMDMSETTPQVESSIDQVVTIL
jgi:hypothetical protein